MNDSACDSPRLRGTIRGFVSYNSTSCTKSGTGCTIGPLSELWNKTLTPHAEDISNILPDLKIAWIQGLHISLSHAKLLPVHCNTRNPTCV